MMGLKAKKTNVGKVDGDTNGYFDLARSTLLSNTQSFLNQMITYNKDAIPESTVKRVNAILNTEDFTLEKVKNAS